MGILAHLSQAATGSLVSAVWQGILLAVVTGFVLRLLPKTPPAVRFAIWFAVFAVVTVLPVAAWWPRAAGSGSGGAWIVLDERWCLAIAAVWAVASLVRAGTLVAAGFRVRALWRRARPVGLANGPQGLKPHFSQDRLDGTAEAVPFREPRSISEICQDRKDPPGGSPGLKPSIFVDRLPRAEARCYSGTRKAQICVSDEVDRPTVIGFFAPKILIPAWLLDKLTPAELEQVVLHEAGHLGRADDWMNLLQKIALVIFPLNPALAWVERRLCFERELAVDERVLHAFAGRPGAAKAYAACLATLAEYRLGRRALALAIGALGRESELGRRVGRILERREGMRPLHAKLVLGGAMLGLLVSAARLERCPQLVGFAGKQGSGVRDQGLVDRAQLAMLPAHMISASYKVQTTSEIRNVSHVTHATMAVSTVQSQARLALLQELNNAEHKAATPATAPPARMVQAMAQVARPHNGPRTISDTEPAAQPTYIVQWVTVTEWQGTDGTQLVMTTAQATVPATGADAQPLPTGTTPAAQDASQQQEPQVLPYAVVPVRGGWLAFQL